MTTIVASKAYRVTTTRTIRTEKKHPSMTDQLDTVSSLPMYMLRFVLGDHTRREWSKVVV